jgi:large subunit ribosomal protein L17
MRHRNSGKKLSRTPAHRKALFRNMAKALLTHGRIRTTETKAMALRGVVDPLIVFALRNDLHARREVYKVLGSHQLVKRLFDEIGPAFAGIAGGYTRVIKLGMPRPGDCAPLAIIELTKMEEIYQSAGDDSQAAGKDSSDSVKTKGAATAKKAKVVIPKEKARSKVMAPAKPKAHAKAPSRVQQKIGGE